MLVLFLSICVKHSTLFRMLIFLENFTHAGCPVYNLFVDYLRNRRQLILNGDCSCDLMDIFYGVPQASNIGLLSFLQYVNDIFNVKFCGRLQLFADDEVYSYTKSKLCFKCTVIWTQTCICYNIKPMLKLFNVLVRLNILDY